MAINICADERRQKTLQTRQYEKHKRTIRVPVPIAVFPLPQKQKERATDSAVKRRQRIKNKYIKASKGHKCSVI